MLLLVSTHKTKKKQKRAENILSSSESPWPSLSQQRWLVKPLVVSAELCAKIPSFVKDPFLRM